LKVFLHKPKKVREKGKYISCYLFLGRGIE
jgi:hypothetical protein